MGSSWGVNAGDMSTRYAVLALSPRETSQVAGLASDSLVTSDPRERPPQWTGARQIYARAARTAARMVSGVVTVRAVRTARR
jgi:hypothetical protein